MLKTTMDAKMRPKMNKKLEDMITAAWAEFNEIAKEEEDGGYSDAMLSMDRTRAEGYAEGLQAAYTLIYGGSNE